MRHNRSTAIAPTSRCSRARLAAAAIASGGFVTLLAISSRLADDVDFLGLSDDTIHLVGHLGVYGGLGVLLFKALGDRATRAWVIANIMAGGEEFRQQFIPGRKACLEDGLVNLLAITVAIALAVIVTRWWQSRRSAARADDATFNPAVAA